MDTPDLQEDHEYKPFHTENGRENSGCDNPSWVSPVGPVDKPEVGQAG